MHRRRSRYRRLVGANDRIVRLFGPSGGDGGVGVNFSPDDRLLATAGSDGDLRVWDVRRDLRIADVPSGRNSLNDVDFSHDGSQLAAAGLGGFVEIWDVVHRRLERKVGHAPPLFFAIRFSPDGKQIATGDSTGSVAFWDAASGRQAPPLRTEVGPVGSVTFSPDGSEVMTTGGGRDATPLGPRFAQTRRRSAPGVEHNRVGHVLPGRPPRDFYLRLRCRRRLGRRSGGLGAGGMRRRKP